MKFIFVFSIFFALAVVELYKYRTPRPSETEHGKFVRKSRAVDRIGFYFCATIFATALIYEVGN